MSKEKVIQAFGWFLFACVYIGGIDLAAMYLILEKDAIGMIETMHPTQLFGWILLLCIGFCVYSLFMFLVACLFDALSSWILHGLLKARKKLKEYKKKLKDDAENRPRKGPVKKPKNRRPLSGQGWEHDRD